MTENGEGEGYALKAYRILLILTKLYWLTIGVLTVIGALNHNWEPAPSLLHTPEPLELALGVMLVIGAVLCLVAIFTRWADLNANWTVESVGLWLCIGAWFSIAGAGLVTNHRAAVPITSYFYNLAMASFRLMDVTATDRRQMRKLGRRK